jgi:tRNA uridine 5-carbamoylmethylation protein Kti12
MKELYIIGGSNGAGKTTFAKEFLPGMKKEDQTLTEKPKLSEYADDIVQKWVDYFVLHKSVECQKITGFRRSEPPFAGRERFAFMGVNSRFAV